MRLSRLLLLPLVASCDLLTPNPENFRERALAELARNESLWDDSNVRDYDMSFQRECLGVTCGPIATQPVRIHVRNDAIARVLDSQGTEVPPQAGISWPTVDSLYLWTRLLLQNRQVVVEVAFDTVKHFPSYVRGENPGYQRVEHFVDNLDIVPPGTPIVATAPIVIRNRKP